MVNKARTYIEKKIYTKRPCDVCECRFMPNRHNQLCCSNQCTKQKFEWKYTKTYWFRLRWEILLRDSFTCQYCGRTPKQGVILTIDHIVPKIQGGKNTKDNLITSCRCCNSGKSDILLKQHDLEKVHKLMLENVDDEK